MTRFDVRWVRSGGVWEGVGDYRRFIVHRYGRKWRMRVCTADGRILTERMYGTLGGCRRDAYLIHRTVVDQRVKAMLHDITSEPPNHHD